jgi:hypothetical protein
MHAHRRQFAWQILVPLLVAVGLVIAAAVLISSGAGSLTRTWADVSIIWLILPALFFAVFFVIVLGFLIYGVARLLQVTPHYSGKAQDFLGLFSSWTRKIADGSARPFFWVHQAGAVLKSIFKR